MLNSITGLALRVITAVGVWLAFCMPATASHPVTGNGFGFAVVAPESGTGDEILSPSPQLHPARSGQSAERRDRDGQLHQVAELGQAGTAGTADYVADSHVIRMRRADGSGTFFMPFGFERPALIIARRTSAPRGACEWNRPLAVTQSRGRGGRKAVAVRGDRRAVAADPARAGAQRPPPDEPLAASPAWALDRAREGRRRRAGHPRIRCAGARGFLPRALVQREVAEFEQWRAKPTVRFKNEQGAPPVAAKRNDAAHGAKPRAEPSGPIRQRADRRGPARSLFNALGPRHGVGDGGAGAHGPPGRGARGPPRLLQCPADRQNAQPK